MFWHIKVLFSSMELEICYTSNVELQKDTTMAGVCNKGLNRVVQKMKFLAS
jgi:hypothetical protein